MKKLNKLNINSEKIIKNVELVTLRGGYNYCCWCIGPGYYGAMVALTPGDCQSACSSINSIWDWKC